MTFPALFEFCRDKTMRRHVHAFVLYIELVARPNAFVEPITVKAWVFAQLLGIHRQHVAQALDLLIRSGYLNELPREHAKAPRRVTVAIEKRPMTSKLCIVERSAA